MPATDTAEARRDIARRFVEEVWGKSDDNLARQIVDPHVVHFRQRRAEPFGIEGLLQGLQLFDTGFPDRRFVQNAVMVDGDYVVDRWTMTAVHEGDFIGNPATGNLVRLTGMNRYLIEGGKIVEITHDEDIYSLALQTGGLPVPGTPGGGAPIQGGWPPRPSAIYALPGPQVEPHGALWSLDGAPLPQVVGIAEVLRRTDDRRSPFYFPDYPAQAETAEEIEELLELASFRDDPAQLAGGEGRRRRLAVSPFLQMRPQPLGAVFNREYSDDAPVVQTGRELARYFESETPGLTHRHAMNFLMVDANWSPPRQTRAWAALDVAIHSALVAAWYYKWIGRGGVKYRPRPTEVDYRVSVIYNRQVNARGSGDGVRRLQPNPSPGTPRHPAYPSGHSTVGGAGSELMSYFFPDYTAEFDQLADNCGMARLWAGIHYRSDHLAGMALGRAVARLVIEQLEASCIPVRPAAAIDTPPTGDQMTRLADQLRRCWETQGTGVRAKAPESSAPVSSAEARERARGPQEGAPGGPAQELTKERARGPQEGTG